MNTINTYQHKQLVEITAGINNTALQEEMKQLQLLHDRYQLELMRIRDSIDEYKILQQNIRVSLRRLQVKERGNTFLIL